MPNIFVGILVVPSVLILGIWLLTALRALKKARGVIKDKEERNGWVMAVLEANSRIVAELRKQGFTMGEGDDDIDSYRCFLQTRETRPSGVVINVMAALNRSLKPAYYYVRIFVVFPHQGSMDEGIPALKRAIAEEVHRKFSPLSQEYLIGQIPMNFADIARRIDEAVKFYERALEKAKPEFPFLTKRVQAAASVKEELVVARNDIQIMINGLIASLADDKELSATG